MSDISAIVSRLEQVATRLEGIAAKGSVGGGAAAAAAAGPAASGAVIEGYDEIVNGSLQNFLTLSKTVGGDVANQSELVAKAFAAQRAFIAVVASSKAPDAAGVQGLCKPTLDAVAEIQAFRENQRKSTQFNHLSAVSEGIPALGWVLMAPKPAPYIKDMSEAGQFYTNRVIKDFKESDPNQVSWAKSFVAVLTELHDYVKKVHTTGLVWNAKGGDASAAAASAPAAAAAAAPKPAAAPVAKPGGNLFAELANKGDGVTAGLKKVDPSMQTHKNPELRASSVVKAEDVPPGAKKPVAAAAATPAVAAKKAPVFELQGKKWVVEHQENNHDIVIKGDMKQSVYIFKCTGSTIRIEGKVNSIVVDGCKKSGIVFEECVASVEAINCISVQIQVLKKVATISIDKTDGIQVYLSEDCKEAEIITAKSSEMNISIPKGDGDFVECAVPEQFKTKWDPATKKLVTTLNDIAA